MVQAILNWLQAIDWGALFSGAALATMGLGARMLMREPLRTIAKDARFIRSFWWLTPQRPLAGKWEITWEVSSSRIPEQNTDIVSIRKFFSNVTFRTSTQLLDGGTEECVFLGKLHDRKITGRWHNAADEEHGYYGVFQVQVHASRKLAEGAWAGFTNDGRVQSNVMHMRLVDERID